MRNYVVIHKNAVYYQHENKLRILSGSTIV